MKIQKIPSAIDVEEAVLGAALIDSSAVGEMIEILRSVNVFFNPKHKAIFEAIVDLFRANESVDLLTVSSKLKSTNRLEKAGGDYKIAELSQKVSSAAHMEYHCRILMQFFVKRKTILLGRSLEKHGYKDDSDIFDVLDNAQRSLDDTTEWLMKKKPDNLRDIVDKLFRKADDKVSGIPSGIPILQRRLNGYQNPNLIILAARPGMGKTALMLNEALSMAKQGYPVGIFSLEMGDTELVARMLSNELSIPNERLALNKLNESEIRKMNEARDWFSKLPVFIYDQQGVTSLELKVQAAKWKRENGIKMIFIDYLQLMTHKVRGGTREQEVSEISRNLKGIAKELDIPVMALSQLNRSVETRGGMKRPLLSDLRESGAIEQDADIVQFLYRPEYYGIENWDYDDNRSTAGEAEINIAKFRNGDTGSIRIGASLKYMRFFDLDDRFDDVPFDNNIPKMDASQAFEKPNENKEDLPF